AAPRGKVWTASAVNGSRKRGTGILQNRIYRGEIVWNRVRMVKDPDTGRRVSRTNPEDEWQSAEAPHLRIIPDDLFDAVLARRGARGECAPEQARRPRHLLSGLLRCGCCGGGMSVKDGTGKRRARVVCTRS